MAEARRSLQAFRDLQEIWVYVAERSPQAANRLIDTFNAKCQALAESPGIGMKRDDLLMGLRSFPVGNYLVFYRQIEEGISIERVIHGARQIEDLFPGNLDTPE